MFTGHFGDQKAVEKIIILLSDLYVEEQEKNSKEKKEKEKPALNMLTSLHYVNTNSGNGVAKQARR